MEAVTHSEEQPHHLRDSLDEETREKLERMRRGSD
jgi:predicted RNA-binding protein with PIN domain